MGGRPLRLMHASDLRLESPLHGAARPPESVRQRFVEAPYEAARRVFDLTLDRQADLLVLAGGVLDPKSASPRAERFLLDQFDRLGEKDIDICWLQAPAGTDNGRWPRRPLPAHVHRLDGDTPDGQTIHRAGQPWVHVVGWHPRRRGKKWPVDARDPAGGVPSIGVVYDPEGLRADRPHPFDYLALGGRHARHDIAGSPPTAHYCGSPQGRSPAEPGPHGCTLVEIPADRTAVRLEPLTTDRARWVEQTIDVDGTIDTGALVSRFDSQLERLVQAAPDRDLLVSWRLTAAECLPGGIDPSRLVAQLLGELRERYADRRPLVWPVSLTIDRSFHVPSGWREEQTIRGDFLRLAAAWRADDTMPVDLQRFLPAELPMAEMRTRPNIDWKLRDRAARQAILSRVERLGIELLGPPHAVDVATEEQAR